MPSWKSSIDFLSPRFCILAVFALVLSLSLVEMLMALDQVTEAISIQLIALIAIACAIPLIRKRLDLSRIDPFEPSVVFSILSILYFVCSPIIGIVLNDFKIFGMENLLKGQSIRMLNLTLSYVLLCILLFFAGYYSRFPTRVANVLPYMHIDTKTIWFRLMLASYTGVGVLCFLGIIYKYHGLPVFSGFARNELAEGGGQYLQAGVSFLKLAFYIMFLNSLTKEKHRKSEYLFLFIYFLFVFIIFVGLGSRTRTFDVFVIMACLFHYVKKRFQFKTMVLTGTCMLGFAVLIFPLLKLLYAAYVLSTLQPESGSVGLEAVLETQKLMFYDKIPQIASILHNVPDVVPFQCGTSFLAFVESFLPGSMRDLLPFKDEGELFMTSIFPQIYALGVGYPISFLGVLYLNFGIIGAFGMYLVGFIAKTLYDYLKSNISNKGVVLTYAIILFRMYGFYGGNFTHAMKFFIIEAAPLFIALFCVSDCTLFYKKDN